jgi:iron complex outermembrane receptor protein
MEISPANDAGKLGGTTQYDLAASYRMGEILPSLAGLTLKPVRRTSPTKRR